MPHNLVVSFEIRDPVRHASLVVGAIEELGAATRIFGTTWYVRSDLCAEDAAERVRDMMHADDGLMVIDVSQNAAATLNVDDRCVHFMRRQWHRAEPVVPLPTNTVPLNSRTAIGNR
jgi:hypothetical protein